MCLKLYLTRYISRKIQKLLCQFIFTSAAKIINHKRATRRYLILSEWIIYIVKRTYIKHISFLLTDLLHVTTYSEPLAKNSSNHNNIYNIFIINTSYSVDARFQ